MWISKKEYNNLKAKADFWEAEYCAMSESKNTVLQVMGDCIKGRDIIIKDLRGKTQLLERTQKELQEYQQKYADEVQKRLELIKLL